MTVMMLLQGGPLDGERQIVEALPTDPGSLMVFNIPNWQTFAPDGTTVVDLGLEAIYSYLQPGPPPVPANGDTWDSAWVYQFAEEIYVAPPAPISPPVVPGNLVNGQVFLALNANLAVAATTIPGAQFLAETHLDVDGTVTPFESAQVTMSAVTVLQAAGYSTFGFGMNATSGMTVAATTQMGPPTLPDGGGVTPASGPHNSANPVTITGTNFTGSTGVTFGGMAATTVVVVSSTQITCNTPLYPSAASVPVVVQNPRGNASTIDPAYTFT